MKWVKMVSGIVKELDHANTARDWIQAITGNDPGPITHLQHFDINSVATPRRTTMPKIRLGCMYCERDDFDGVDTLPEDWEDIEEVRSYEEATREVAMDDNTRSVFDWQI